MNWFGIVVLATSIATALLQRAVAQSADSALAATDLRGSGGWVPNEVAAKPTQRSTLDVKRGDDNSLTGRITLADSPLMQSGNVNGKIDGKQVSGTISDDSGDYVATFDGAVGKSGFSGTYKDRQGGTGNWAWEGKLPQ